jgi:hypothetical protein
MLSVRLNAAQAGKLQKARRTMRKLWIHQQLLVYQVRMESIWTTAMEKNRKMGVHAQKAGQT